MNQVFNRKHWPASHCIGKHRQMRWRKRISPPTKVPSTFRWHNALSEMDGIYVRRRVDLRTHVSNERVCVKNGVSLEYYWESIRLFVEQCGAMRETFMPTHEYQCQTTSMMPITIKITLTRIKRKHRAHTHYMFTHT